MKSKYRARIVSSILVICLSLTSLIGSTFAWFTDSVQTQKNRIVSGNLDIEMYFSNASTGTTGAEKWEDVNEVSATKPNFFVDKDGYAMLWEPGVATYTNFKVVNEGSVALKYQFNTSTDQNRVKINDEWHDLTEVIKIAVIPTAALEAAIESGDVEGAEIVKGKDDEKGGYTDDGAEDVVKFESRDAMLAAVDTMLGNSFQKISDWNYTSYLNASTAVNSSNTYAEVENSHDEECFVVIAYWEPSEFDDNYNLKNHITAEEKAGFDETQLAIDIDIRLNATQFTDEADGFDRFYDVTTEPVLVYDAEEFAAAIDQVKDYGNIYVMKEGLTLDARYDDTRSINVYGQKIEKLTVNVPNGEIHVYNQVGTVVGNDIATDSAHFYNKIGTLKAIAGHFVIEPSARVTTLTMSPATEGENVKELNVEVLGFAQKINTPESKPAAVSTLTIGPAAEVKKLYVKAVEDNIKVIIADGGENTNNKIDYVEVVEFDGELKLSGDTSRIIESNIPAGDNLAELFEALTSGGQKAIPDKITVSNPVTLQSFQAEEGKAGLMANLDGVETTFVLKNTLSIGNNFESDLFSNWAGMRVNGHSTNNSVVTFSGDANGKYTNVDSNVRALVYVESNFDLTFESGTYETTKQILASGAMGSIGQGSMVKIKGGTFIFVGADKDNLVPFESRGLNDVAFMACGPFPPVVITGGTFYNVVLEGNNGLKKYVSEGYHVETSIVGNDLIATVVPDAN